MKELPLRKRVFYGMGGLSMALPDLIMMQWLAYRYVPADADKQLLPAALWGLVFLLGRMTEGLNCPVIVHISDNSGHRWGRRMPFLRFGFSPYLLVFVLLFFPPVEGMHWLNAVYAFVLIEAYFFLYSLVFTPYLALMPELTSDLKERVDLATAQAVFIMLGAFAFGALGIVLDWGGWPALAAGPAVLIVLCFMPVLSVIREKPQTVHDTPPPGLWHSIRLTLHNRPFLHLVAGTSLFFFGLNGVLLLLPYWVVSYLGGTEGDVTLLMLPYLLASVPSFIVFNLLAPRVGKYALMLVTFLSAGVFLGALCLVGRLPLGTPFLQTGIIFGLAGIPMAGFMMLPYALLGDVVDYDERRTGRRREAIYFGVQGVAQKALMGLSVLAFTIVPYIGRSGLDADPTEFGLKAMAVLCGLACLAAFLTFLGYPIRERKGQVIFPEEPKPHETKVCTIYKPKTN